VKSTSIHRRDFNRLALAGSLAGLACKRADAAPEMARSVMVHSHIFIEHQDPMKTTEETDPLRRYDYDSLLRAVRPKLEAVMALGCRRFLECTSPWFGRAPALMKRLAADTGMDIWICTGLRGTAKHRYLPRYAFEESDRQLADRWIREIREGIGGIRARFIKLGVDGGINGAYEGRLAEIDQKLLRAAVITVKETGVTLACHTGDKGHAKITFADILALLQREQMPLDRFVVVHAQHEEDFAWHEEIVRAGCWIEFDGIGRMVDWTAEAVASLAGKGLLHRVLVSEDRPVCMAKSVRDGVFPEQPEYRPYLRIYEEFLPKLEPAWRRQLMIENPVAAFGD
jgi:phosphotriesterase-related protein